MVGCWDEVGGKSVFIIFGFLCTFAGGKRGGKGGKCFESEDVE
jgi:hypothetical protein